MGNSYNPAETNRANWSEVMLLFQARGAKDTIFVFRDAFPAEKTAAFRTPGHGLASSVIKASLTGKIFHQSGHSFRSGEHREKLGERRSIDRIPAESA